MKHSIMKHTIRLSLAGILLLAAITTTGCAHQTTTLPAGAINSFDATSYDVLMTAQGAINGFKTQVSALPANQVTTVTPVLNQAIKDYNTAEAAWQTYHAGATADTSALSAAINQLLTDLAALQSAVPAPGVTPAATPQ